MMKEYMEKFGEWLRHKIRVIRHETVEEAENHLQKFELLKLEESKRF